MRGTGQKVGVCQVLPNPPKHDARTPDSPATERSPSHLNRKAEPVASCGFASALRCAERRRCAAGERRPAGRSETGLVLAGGSTARRRRTPRQTARLVGADASRAGERAGRRASPCLLARRSVIHPKQLPLAGGLIQLHVEDERFSIITNGLEAPTDPGWWKVGWVPDEFAGVPELGRTVVDSIPLACPDQSRWNSIVLPQCDLFPSAHHLDLP